MRAAKVLAVMFLAIRGAAFGQAPVTTSPGTNGKSPITTFQHQTLGESWEEFMRISGTQMCASHEQQAAQWCDAFKKIEASGHGDVVVAGEAASSAMLKFSERKLVQVLLKGN